MPKLPTIQINEILDAHEALEQLCSKGQNLDDMNCYSDEELQRLCDSWELNMSNKKIILLFLVCCLILQVCVWAIIYNQINTHSWYSIPNIIILAVIALVFAVGTVGFSGKMINSFFEVCGQAVATIALCKIEIIFIYSVFFIFNEHYNVYLVTAAVILSMIIPIYVFGAITKDFEQKGS